MNPEELKKILLAAQDAEKYVWLKHRFDRCPRSGRFELSNDGTLRVSLYLSFIDDHEGVATISPNDVEWAHVSTQTLASVIRSRLSHAEESQTLVRLFFSDFIEPQLIKHDCYTCEAHETVIFGHFVQEESLLSDPIRSRVPLKVLLDVQNTDIGNTSATASNQFSGMCSEPNLCHFAERKEAW